jgi:cobaltochelatase CobT subunit
MKANNFTNELAKTSSVFGRKKNIEVIFEGDGAKTDGSKVYLPAINMQADVSDEQAAIMRGYVDHEAGHVRHTDFQVLRDNREKMQGNKLLHSCANALEDVWLEQRVREEYDGAETNLRAVSTAVNSEFIKHVKHDDERLRDPVWVGPVAATWAGRKDYGGDTNEECLAMLDDEMHEMITDIVKRVDGCKDSRDVFALAEEFEGKLRGAKAERDEPTGSEEGETGDEDGDDQGDVGDTTRGEHESDEDGADKPEGSDVDADDADDSTDDARGDSTADEADVDDDVYDDFGVEAALKKVMEDPDMTGVKGDRYRPYTTKYDTWLHRSDGPKKYTPKGRNKGHNIMGKVDASEYEKVLGEMSGVVNMCRRKLERALIAKQNRDWDNAKESGRLDTRRLTAAVAGKVNVFKTRTDRDEMDTALTLLVDLSGSMSGRPIHMARQVVIAFCEALDRTGIKYEVLGFDNSFLHRSTCPPELMEMRGEYWERDYDRLEPLNMAVFKHFDERLYECKGSIASIVHMAQGNNTDGEAVALAHDRLKARAEKRKVMMVLSDGEPAAEGNRSAHHKHLRSITSAIEATSTDLIGIGIMSDAVERFYKHNVVVHSLDDLQGVVMGELAKLLLGDRVVLDHTKLIDHAV